jgi:hypothetical protein
MSVLDYLQHKAQAQKCAGVHDANGQCEGNPAGSIAVEGAGKRQKDDSATGNRASGSVAEPQKNDTHGSRARRDAAGS